MPPSHDVNLPKHWCQSFPCSPIISQRVHTLIWTLNILAVFGILLEAYFESSLHIYNILWYHFEVHGHNNHQHNFNPLSTLGQKNETSKFFFSIVANLPSWFPGLGFIPRLDFVEVLQNWLIVSPGFISLLDSLILSFATPSWLHLDLCSSQDWIFCWSKFCKQDPGSKGFSGNKTETQDSARVTQVKKILRKVPDQLLEAGKSS